MSVSDIPSKTCSTCKTVKEHSEFRLKSDKPYYQCKTCEKLYKAEYSKKKSNERNILKNSLMINPQDKYPDQQWKKLEFGKNDYYISDHGNCWSERLQGILKPVILTGYYKISIDRKQYFIHRLVAQYFIDNPKPTNDIVNHLDQNKLNNLSSNLEWTDASGNVRHSLIGKSSKKIKSISQYDLSGNFIAKFDSVKSAAKHVDGWSSDLSKKCKAREPYKNYTWKYDEEEEKLWVKDEFTHICIKDYETYEITEYGRIYSGGYGQYMKPRIDANGYWYIELCKGGQKTSYPVHKLVCLHFIGPCPGDNYVVNHKDNDPDNNHFSNLEWLTCSENSLHYWNLQRTQAIK